MESNGIKALTIVCIAVGYSAGVLADQSGLSKFWADNYKAFHQIYGKTSDLDLYGQTLPLSITHGAIESNRFKKSDAIRSRIEHTTQQYYEDPDSTSADTRVDPFEYSNTFAQLLGMRSQNRNKQTLPKHTSTKYGNNYAADESIIHSLKSVTDQATLDYLKQFEHLETQQAIDFPQEGLTGFKPFAGIPHGNIRGQRPVLDSYKSIQDIIDANEDAAVFERQKANHDLAHKTYGYIPKIKFEGVDNLPKQQVKSNKPRVRFVQGNNISKKPSRGCSTGRCRKPPSQLRVRKVRPRITKVKHRIVSL